MVTLGVPSIMMAPYETRLIMFIVSCTSVVTFNMQLVFLFWKYINSKTPLETFTEVIYLYIFMLQLGLYIPSLYIFMYDGLGMSPYALFNPRYPKDGNWNHVIIRPAEENHKKGKKLL